MEVKIKIGGEMIDATIEMVDGVMVVSPKVEKFEPKDGDVIHCTNSNCSYVAIFRNISKCGTLFYRYAVLIDNGVFKINTSRCDFSDYSNPRPATEEEKQELFDKLKEEGYEWKADTKELVKLKWKPKAGQSYYIPIICNAKFKAIIEDWSDDSMDVLYFDKGWCFKTKEECQAFCEKLNQAIELVKP